ncbi:flagellar hook-associated protein 2 [Desulfonispora thiosulfatigenes DSM 11270]|uniref:Flagellar hook-associated protein 2 n=1 Tax=Desulfonispora thiosulfatigenes DSM 11270 TaxID=656914 RepID=A0A1W1UP38_DESTI|nr:flagellar filament capping protein FliD [Desulfonispora thiosulfatigenes]SMB82769.1 flagellar hook-associated protein 2 [Desulfonispora thiosulfatigenes DSM 11270]
MKIGGLASGMDTDSIVKDMMKVAKMPLDKLNQEKQWLEWQQEDYREINKSLFSFRDKLFDLKLQGTFQAKSASTSQDKVATVTAGNSATPGNYELQVNELAKGAFRTSTGKIDTGYIEGQTLAEQYSGAGWTKTTEEGKEVIKGQIRINDKVTIEFDAETDSIKDIAAKINEKMETTGVTAVFNADTNKFFLANVDSSFGKEIKVEGIDLEGTNNGAKLLTSLDAQMSTIKGLADFETKLKINGTEITFNRATDSFEQIAKKINEHEKDTGVRASYDKGTERFFFSTSTTGADAKIDFSGTTDKGLEFLDTIKIGATMESGTDKGKVAGLNAKVTLNGTDFEMAENKFTINGLTYELKGVNTTENPTTSIVITNDTGAVFDKIKEFVEDYNKLLEQVNGKMDEKKYRSFHALSKEEKEAMTDKEVELWEEKAKSGTLRNDSTLRDLLGKMRMATSSYLKDIDSEYNSLKSIGIATQNYYEGGKLHLDEDKLKKALNEDPDAVQKIFTLKGEDDKSLGIGDSLYDIVNNGTKAVVEKAGRVSIKGVDDSFLGKRLKNMQKSIASWEDRLVRIEDRYWSQFTAMEKALSQMNSQSSWLAQQFSQG